MIIKGETVDPGLVLPGRRLAALLLLGLGQALHCVGVGALRGRFPLSVRGVL